MDLQFEVDDRELRSLLRNFPRQIAFAQSLALNNTAKKIRKHTVSTVWPRSVNRKARGFAGRAFWTRFAKKREIQLTGTTIAAVFADPSRVSPEGIEAIKRVEEGLRHYPYSSRWLAVPTRNALTPTGRLSKNAKLALSRAAPNTFVADLRGRGPAIWQRKGKGGLVMLFVLKPSVPTPKVFRFAAEAARLARRVWPEEMIRAAIKAVRTAK